MQYQFEENCLSHFQHTSDQSFILISLFFSSFLTLCKICYKTPMCALIRLSFGTCKGLIKADFSTKFGRNPMNIYGDMTNYLHKIRLNLCHAHRVNPLEE